MQLKVNVGFLFCGDALHNIKCMNLSVSKNYLRQNYQNSKPDAWGESGTCSSYGNVQRGLFLEALLGLVSNFSCFSACY